MVHEEISSKGAITCENAEPSPRGTGSVHRHLAVLSRLGYEPTQDASILDFGCGSGSTVYSLLDHGFAKAIGFDIKDYLELRSPEDNRHFKIGLSDGCLPFDDASFDLIISDTVFEHVQDQIPTWRELHRIMKPGSIASHAFPAPYCLIEPHNYVPFGGVFPHYWWYKLWALAGIRNKFQQGLSATQTARWNTLRYVENLNYVNNSCYKVIWEDLGFEWKWIDQEALDTNSRSVMRLAGRVNRIFPLICWAQRTFVSRRVLLKRN